MLLTLKRYLNVGSPIVYPTRAFASILPINDGYVALVREFDIQEGHRSHIRKLEYDKNFTLLNDEFLCLGEDPRMFYFCNELYATIITWSPDDDGDWQQWLVRVKDSYKTELKLPDCFQGKNWIPINKDETLYIIYSFDPLVVLRANNDGECKCVYGNHESVKVVSEWRGGTNAIYKDGLITGFGHKTQNGNLHTCFFYTIDSNWQIKIEECEIEWIPGLTPATIEYKTGLVDPTSYWDNKIGATLAERSWDNYQPIFHTILEVKATNKENSHVFDKHSQRL